MNLRFLIFFTVSAIGTLPLGLFLLLNLPSSIHQLDVAAQQETMARSRIHFSELNSRISCLEKSIMRLATVPVSRDMVTGDGDDELSTSRLMGLVLSWFADSMQIRAVQFIDLVGNERFRASRDAQSELQRAGREQLRSREQATSFLIGLHLQPGEVFVGVSGPQDGGQRDFFMVTPVTGQGEEMVGLLVLLVDLPSFLGEFKDALWVLADGMILHRPAALSAELEVPSRVKDPAGQGERQPFIQDVGPGQLSWLPISFNPDQRPIMWVGRQVDLSTSQRWKASLLQNLGGIVAVTVAMVFVLAHFMSGRLMRVRQEIIEGLGRLLNHEQPAQFSWQRPAELRQLAQDLSQLGDLYLQTRQARREAEEKFRNLTDSAHDAIIFMDHTGDITFWNRAAETIFGYRAEEALGQPAHSLISLRRPESGEGMDVPSSQDGTQVDEVLELIATRKDGSELPLELSLSATSMDERWHAIWVVRDISERKKAAAEALFQQQQLIQADKMISLGLLVSGVAHEINNPNSIVMLNTPMLQRAWQSVQPILEEFYQDNGDFLVAGLEYSEMRGQIPRLFAEIEEGSRKIKGIVHDLKDYARQESTAHQQTMDLNLVAEAAVRLTRNAVKNSTNHFSLELGQELPAIMGNMQRLEQVVINLIQNSCEALAGPEKAIGLRTAASADGKQVILQVMDQGCGIDRQAVGKVCDPFYTTKRGQGGTGLGLSVSAGIIKEHKGVLRFEPGENGGTVATIAFPVA